MIFNQTGDYIGFGFFVFDQDVLPNYLAKYASSVLLLYTGVIFIVAASFRTGFVPSTYMIYIDDAPYTQDLLAIC